MSASPPQDENDATVASPEESNDQGGAGVDHIAALGYEFEVKEQDRWLPIANGML
jgi:nuclear transcription Y subunit beta